MTSTADVIIHVGDENDNPPTFDRYPASSVNTTYLVSTRAQRGHVITRLRTSDADSGINSRVTFQLADVTARDGDDASASGLFHIDRDLGIVSVAAGGGLSDRDGTTFDLIVVAMDGGEPPMSAFTTVSIAVNSSVVDVPVSGADRRRSIVVRQNLLVVVAFAVVSGLITVCLVVAIVFIRRGDRRRRKPAGGCGSRSRKYNCRMESLQHAAPDSTHDEPLQPAAISIYNGVDKTCEPEITSYCAAEQETKMRLSSQVFRPNYRVCTQYRLYVLVLFVAFLSGPCSGLAAYTRQIAGAVEIFPTCHIIMTVNIQKYQNFK